MNYPSSIPPYIQNAMAQATQAIMSGGPLPPNCFIITIPIQQAQQMFPQIMMNYAPGGGAMMFSQQPSYYGQLYQPQIDPYQNNPQQISPYQNNPPPVGPYQNNQPSNGLLPYSNYYSQGYGQNYNYPVVPYYDYNNKSKKKNRHGKKNRLEPHSNVYNSSSFDSNMRKLSWSRLFGNHHHHHRHHRHSKQENKDQAALSYDQKQKRRDQSSDTLTSTTSSSSTTSDETIRRVNVLTKQPSTPSSKQQTKSSLPFKYSSEFVPGVGKQQQQQNSNKKEVKLRSDDIFIVKKTQPSSSAQK